MTIKVDKDGYPLSGRYRRFYRLLTPNPWAKPLSGYVGWDYKRRSYVFRPRTQADLRELKEYPLVFTPSIELSGLEVCTNLERITWRELTAVPMY